MAGHSQFANIKHRKGAQDAKRAKIFTKLLREVLSACKEGLPDPESNSRLRAAIIAARAKNVPKDRIQGAINSGSSKDNTDNFEEMRYEGYGPAGTAIIVEALTDNRNRTASDVRSAFTKFAGNLGETGSVNFMFDKLGCVEYSKDQIKNFDALFETSVEVGASDCLEDGGFYIIYCAPETLHAVRDGLHAKFGDAESAKLTWKPQNLVEINDLEDAQKLMRFTDMLEDSDDVQHIFSNFVISEKVLKQMDE